MELIKLERYSDDSLKKLNTAANEHFNGRREDKSAMVQALLSNATARQISVNLSIRKTKIREALAAA